MVWLHTSRLVNSKSTHTLASIIQALEYIYFTIIMLISLGDRDYPHFRLCSMCLILCVIYFLLMCFHLFWLDSRYFCLLIGKFFLAIGAFLIISSRLSFLVPVKITRVRYTTLLCSHFTHSLGLFSHCFFLNLIDIWNWNYKI